MRAHERHSDSGSTPKGGSRLGNRSIHPRHAAMMALQGTAGNAAVSSALSAVRSGAVVAVVQRGLYPLDAPMRPGRLRQTEAVSLDELLRANGYEVADRKKARSDPAHKADLDARFQWVTQTDGKFDGSNIKPQKRRKLRALLATEYDQLLDAAERYRDEATAAHEAAIDGVVTDIRKANPTVNRLFKGGSGPWNTGARDATDGNKIGTRLLAFTAVEDFRAAVFTRYNARFKPGGTAPAIAPLSAQEQAALAAEKAGVNAQLQTWNNLPYDAQGCNAAGTWGTCVTGSLNFQPSHLTERVWTKLRQWWRTKAGAYVTPSETTTWSLKMYRDTDNLSATFNYHVYVP